MNRNELIKRYNAGEKISYIFFWGHKSRNNFVDRTCLSQWYISYFKDEEREYCCMEQYMMYNKAKLFNDHSTAAEIMCVRDPKKIKALGRKVKNFKEEVWDKNKFEIVVRGNVLKFSQNKELKEFLLSTNDAVLVEASPYDKVWGVGLKRDDIKINNPNKWQGENLLGFALMEVREELLKKEKS